VSEARSAAGLTQGELGAETSIERSAINKIENGSRRVSAFELSEIARALGRRMDWFLTEPTPSIVSRREREGASSRTVDIEIERAARDVEQVEELTQSLALVECEPQPMPINSEEAEALAADVRRWMKVGADEPLTDLAGAAEKIGLLIFSQPLGADAADGATVLLERGGVAVVNSTSDVGRRRLTAAHEIGHYVVADAYTVDHEVLVMSDSGREALIDRFARALLIPPAAVASYWAEQLKEHDERVATLRTASHFRIDFATVARRLLDIGAIDGEGAQRLRAVRASRADFVEYNLHVPTDMEGVTFPRSFELAVFDLYRTERISAARAIALLLDVCTEQDLPRRPQRTEGETWQFVT
jgi:Zn-dependent peptidase ImmA (M78 family)/DNA-binding XRE family transcriptional regulator